MDEQTAELDEARRVLERLAEQRGVLASVLEDAADRVRAGFAPDRRDLMRR